MNRQFTVGSGARAESTAEPGEGLGSPEVEHPAGAESFYMAIVSETGWPYVRHRGGPRGFLKVMSPARLAYADFAANHQVVSIGNTTRDDRVSLIVMDYPKRRRLKLMGRLRFEAIDDADAALEAAVDLPGYRARIERVGVIDIEAINWNCPQHITPRFALSDVEATVAPLQVRIRRLEAEIASFRAAHNPTTCAKRNVS